MDSFLQLAPWLVAMMLLALVSAFCSASEAALFYLRPSDRRRLAAGSPGERSAARLLNDPEKLLSAILFCNLLANLFYFSVSQICSFRLEQSEEFGPFAAVVFAMISLIVLIFVGEMFPKTIGVLMPTRLARTIGMPMTLVVRVVSPFMPVLQLFNRVSQRIFLPGFKQEQYLESADIERAIEISGIDDALIKQEQAVLQNVVQLSNIRIDEWMRPRTQFEVFSPPVKLSDLRGEIPAGGYLLIAEAQTEEIERAIRLNSILDLPQENLERISDPVLYLPWCATVADALEKMTHRDRDVTVVVNEFGETIGILTIEDILETVFHYSPSRSKRLLDLNPFHQISDGKWVVAGIMSLRQLARKLEVEIPRTHTVTIAGVIQEGMQRLAQAGDEVNWGPFHFRVIECAELGNMIVELTLVSTREGT